MIRAGSSRSRPAAPLRGAAACALALAWAAASAGPARGEVSLELASLPDPVDEPARVVSRVPVLYPEAARRDGVAGIVLVRARVGRDGRVREAVTSHSLPPLDEAALTLVRRFEFSPARRDGREVESWVEVPVRFDASLPSGTRGVERVAVEPYSDLQREFESEVEVLREGGPVAPSEEDAAQRERVMRASLRLDAIPPPGAEAIRALRDAESPAHGSGPGSRERRREAWALAAYRAPWWPLPYRRLCAAAIADRDYARAEICAAIVLAGRPGDAEAEALFRRARQLRLGEGREAGGGKKASR